MTDINIIVSLNATERGIFVSADRSHRAAPPAKTVHVLAFRGFSRH
ncbi:hypothetical protein [Deinococcus hopiensis]|uniref:Uncharacterized protein n=1 Tax=Deinococcus hopiensis KR-140 TaxID=695939 RepID=A0A1W1VB02_9DEIO|nr:hypothetical protein [Deinococcus hopiensis]SMB90231.1 hypothetical protein SAMN00790413_00690 [Deinococcus hopiensis KR-140]